MVHAERAHVIPLDSARKERTSDILSAVASQALIVAKAARKLGKGTPLSWPERKRVELAAERLETAANLWKENRWGVADEE